MKFIKFSAATSILLFYATFVSPAAGAQAENKAAPKYIGCTYSHKFHRPGCIFAKAISNRHLVLFQWRKQAISAHFQPCRYCLPPVWLSTRAIILPANSNQPNIKSVDDKSDRQIQKNEQHRIAL